jgi:hypothetical protein
MLFDTALQYVINSVIVLTLAEVDELLFKCFSKSLLHMATTAGEEQDARKKEEHDQEELSHHHHLTPTEQNENERFTNLWLLPLTAISMLAPLLTGKLTGAHCSERSRFRVSEICLFLLLSARLVSNIALDVRTSPKSSSKSFVRIVLSSVFEHVVPTISYLFLLDFVLVKVLKPSTDDDLFNG